MTELLYTIVVNQPGYLPGEPASLAANVEDARNIALDLAAYSFDDERVPADLCEAIQALPGVVALPDGYVIEITAVTEDEVREFLACHRCGDVGTIMTSAGYAFCPIGGEWCGEDIALMTPDELVERWAA
jgi:hypothetical protein